jgi:hypothetical protein
MTSESWSDVSISFSISPLLRKNRWAPWSNCAGSSDPLIYIKAQARQIAKLGQLFAAGIGGRGCNQE